MKRDELMDDDRARIFVSYARKDKERKDLFFQSILDDALSEVCEFLVDESIQPSEQWDLKIRDLILESDVSILLITPGFLESAYILNTELPFIKSARRPILAVLLSGVDARALEALCLGEIYPQNGSPLGGLKRSSKPIVHLRNRIKFDAYDIFEHHCNNESEQLTIMTEKETKVLELYHDRNGHPLVVRKTIWKWNGLALLGCIPVCFLLLRMMSPHFLNDRLGITLCLYISNAITTAVIALTFYLLTLPFEFFFVVAYVALAALVNPLIFLPVYFIYAIIGHAVGVSVPLLTFYSWTTECFVLYFVYRPGHRRFLKVYHDLARASLVPPGGWLIDRSDKIHT